MPRRIPCHLTSRHLCHREPWAQSGHSDLPVRQCHAQKGLRIRSVPGSPPRRPQSAATDASRPDRMCRRIIVRHRTDMGIGSLDARLPSVTVEGDSPSRRPAIPVGGSRGSRTLTPFGRRYLKPVRLPVPPYSLAAVSIANCRSAMWACAGGENRRLCPAPDADASRTQDCVVQAICPVRSRDAEGGERVARVAGVVAEPGSDVVMAGGRRRRGCEGRPWPEVRFRCARRRRLRRRWKSRPRGGAGLIRRISSRPCVVARPLSCS